jgi:hypothetical protein
MCKNIVEPDRPLMTLWRMHIACWIPKARNTNAKYVIPTAFRLQQWLHERASLLRYTYIANLVLITLVNTQNVSVTKIVNSSIECAESKYGLRIQFLALVVMIHEVWLNA